MLHDFLSPIILSIEIAMVSGMIVIVSGTLIGRYLSMKFFKGKAVFETFLMLPLVLPPSVVGFILIILFGKQSIMGQAIEWIFEKPVIFTWWAAVIAAVVVAFPLMYQSAKSGFQGIDHEIEDAARVDGASERKVFLYVSIPLAARALMTGGVLSFARALGEFGATLMFAGNIPGVTQTVPIAVYTALESGNMLLAWMWVIAIVLLSFLLLFAVQSNKERYL